MTYDVRDVLRMFSSLRVFKKIHLEKNLVKTIKNEELK